MKIEDYGVLGLSWRTCSWAGEIFARSERYFKMLSNTYDFEVVEKGEDAYVYLNREPHRRGLELSNEATLSATVVVLQAMTESKIIPTQVKFKHAAPTDLSSYEQAFQCEILFDQDHYSIRYKTADLHMRTAKADREINNFLIERVKEETQGIALGGDRLADDVEHLIRNALPSGIPAIDEIATQLGMSNRTLSRRLAEVQLSFRDLIRKSQEEVAKDLLKNTDRSLAEIAFETGFSDQTAFNRFFYAWSVSVIPGTKRLADLTYLESMQSINRAILNPAFFVVFFGSMILLWLVTYQSYSANKTMFIFMLIAAITYTV
ncbi:unnamed protein product, partial [Symbiodinium microadriaticum]